MDFRSKMFRSLSSTINTVYFVLLTIFLLLLGSILILVANNQVEQTTTESQDAVLAQKNEYISFLYQDIFEQFYRLSNEWSLERLLTNPVDSTPYYLELSEKVEEIVTRNASLVDSVYVNIQDQYILTSSEQQSLEPSFELSAFPGPPGQTREGFYWLNTHTDPIFNRHQEVQSIVYNLQDSMNQPVGKIILNLKSSFVQNTLNEIPVEDSFFLLVSKDGIVSGDFSEEQQAVVNEITERYREGSLEKEEQEISDANGNSYLVRYEVIGTNKWASVYAAPKKTLFNSNAWLPYLIVFITIVLGLIVTAMIRLLRRYISIPIEQLAINMRSTESYQEKLSWPEDMPGELAILYETYNSLTDRNIHLIEHMTAQQQEKMQLEVALLHAQISPHFLYNTLTSIKGLCDMGMNEEASSMIQNLSDFFRTSLSRGKEVIPIRDEVRNIESYLYMMEMRYGDYFSYQISIPEEYHDCSIVKLTLQPLVENAIIHGVMNSREKGIIEIGLEETSGDLRLSVRDNGAGLAPDQLRRIQEEIYAPYLSSTRAHTGVGLRSVDIRIKNRYGDSYGLTIESELGEYSCVSVKIPKC